MTRILIALLILFGAASWADMTAAQTPATPVAQRADDLGRLAAPLRSALDRILGRDPRRPRDRSGGDDMASAA